MLHGYTIIAVSHEQAINILAETVDVSSALDTGCGIMTVAQHPQHGDLIILDNAIGKCAIALHQDHAKKFTS
jgi:hypothetical protein